MDLEKRLKGLLRSQVLDFEDNVSAVQFIFSVQKNKKSLFTHSLGLSNPDYWSLVQKFVSEYGSLLSIDSKRNVYSRKIKNSYKHQKTKENKLSFFEEEIEVEIIDKGRKKLKYSDWVNYLGVENFGQWSLWAVFNNDHLINNNRYRLDAFLILNYYPSQYDKLKIYDFIRQFFLNEGVNIIVNNLFNDIKDHATKAATSRIINRNYAHHIGSHVSHRATADKIFERLFGSYDLNKIRERGWEVDITLKSIVEMENRLTRYKDERNEFISGIENNSHPVSAMFYKDIIQSFVENSLLMDNIAKSEGICWKSEDTSRNDGQVKEDGICKLRIRVFYHQDIINTTPGTAPCLIKGFSCTYDIPCMQKDREYDSSYERLSLSDLGIDNKWHEMMAIYDLGGSSEDEKNGKREKVVCIHRLPYYKKLASDGNGFFESISYSLDDIEVAIPGTLGTHSVFSLLENHIRNTAKHARGSAIGKDLPVNIILKVSKAKDEVASSSDYYNLEITSNVPTIYKNEHLNKIKKALKETVDIDTKALGFADMRINACLLAFRKINQFNLDRSIEEPGDYYPKKALLGNNQSDEEKEKLPRSVSFGMLLTKPCKIVFVGEKFQALGTPAREKQGIRQFDTDEDCIKALDDMPRAFEFAVVEEMIFHKALKHDLFLKVLPWRVLVTPGSNKENIIESYLNIYNQLKRQRRITEAGEPDFKANCSAGEILYWCWDTWLRNRWEKSFILNINFDRSEELERRYLESSKGFRPADNDNGLTVNILTKENSPDVYKTPDCFEVFYDRHGKYLNAIAEKTSNDANLLSRLSWVYFDKNNPDFDILASNQLAHPFLSFCRLIESGVHKILVIDERARERGIKIFEDSYLGENIDDEEENPYIKFALASRVLIADSFLIHKEEVLFDVESENNSEKEKYLQVCLKKSSKGGVTFHGMFEDRIGINEQNPTNQIDTLIIHRTMLSKLFEIDKQLFSVLSDQFPNIIVTTGGGTLKYDDNEMDRIRMIPFSAINKYLLNGAIAKNALTNLI